ncbi:patatin-like phospholipase family protein [Wenjunlia tyrosinilytica]|uniref:PNPLA domain-containing protein n=1 Tax=Wenjunlia tyrosinilytica TaxID=1544741 RepID=A0A917ZD67_9ACTN|nr:patatin-like phospholipase family protein [Wenjunlia tyrosinilytica]GGO80317.1 hypothetical protein GCM10012280_01940 [Wenjunlia tyrosinilytica]
MGDRALVLGGGGLTGIGWEWGVLAGLADAGIDLTDADLFVGTSAGSVVGVHLACGADVQVYYERQLEEPVGEMTGGLGMREKMRMAAALFGEGDEQEARARFGRMSLAVPTVPQEQRRKVIASRLATHTWPDRRLLITAVDVDSGEFAAFDRESGVDLIDAVAASCAVPGVWPPVPIKGRRWMDGGVRSPANVDLAAGCERIVVLAPMTAGLGAIKSVADQVRELGEGPEVVVVSPDPATRRIVGGDMLDPARRAPAARAGREQAASAADAVAEVWSTV